MFKVNEGTADRAIRVIAGVVLLALYFFGSLGTWGWVAAVLGAVALVTGAMGVCPLYSLLGVSTCPVKNA